MNKQIFIILLLFLLVFVCSNEEPKKYNKISTDLNSQFYIFNNGNLNSNNENNSTDNNTDNNHEQSTDNDDDEKHKSGDGDDDDDDDGVKKGLIIALSIGSGLIVIVIVVIFVIFIRSKLTYDKLNEKINKISFSEERDNRDTTTEDLV